MSELGSARTMLWPLARYGFCPRRPRTPTASMAGQGRRSSERISEQVRPVLYWGPPACPCASSNWRSAFRAKSVTEASGCKRSISSSSPRASASLPCLP